MTGQELFLRLRKRVPLHVGVRRGSPCRYEPRERIVYLAGNVYDGETPSAHAIVAHELAHSCQVGQMGGGWVTLASRIEPFNLWLEWRAWKRAIILLCDELHPNLETLGRWEDTRKACLIKDTYRAGAYGAGAALLCGAALWLRALVGA